MEIMTTWNGNFEFDIQMFADRTLAAVGANSTANPAGVVGLTGTVVYDGADGTSAKVAVAASTKYQLFVKADGSEVVLGTAAVESLSGYTLIGEITPASTTVAVSDPITVSYTGDTFAVSLTNLTGTVNVKKGAILAQNDDVKNLYSTSADQVMLETSGSVATAGSGVKVLAGTVKIDATLDADLTSAAEGSKASYTLKNTASGEVSVAAGTITVTEADNTSGTITIAKDGTVAGLTGTDTAVLKDTEATPNTLVTAKGAGSVKFVTSETYAAKVESADSGLTLTAGSTQKVDFLGKAVTASNGAKATVGASSTITLTDGTFASAAENTEVAVDAVDVTIGKVTFYESGTGVVDATATYKSETAFTLKTGVANIDSTVTSELSITSAGGNTVKFTNASNVNPLKVAAVGGEIGIFGTTSAVKGTAGNTYNVVFDSTGLKLGDNVVVTTGTVEVGTKNAAGDATVKGLDVVGEEVTITDKNTSGMTRTLKVVDVSGTLATVSVTDSTGTNYYTASTTFAWDDTLAGATLVTAKDITTSAWTTGTTYFTAIGTPTSTVLTDPGAKLEVNGTTKTLTVYKALDTTKVKVDLSKDSTVNVVDNGTTVKYVVESGANLFTAEGRTFTVTDGVVTAADGTIKLDTAATKFAAQGTVSVDATGTTTPVITYKTGTDIDGAKVTLAATKYFTLKENNSGSSAEDTVITVGTGITGLDGDATITTSNITNGDIGTIKTTGSGSFTYNKVTYVVAEDSDGVTFTTGTDVLTAVSGLDQDATITISSKLSDAALTVNTAGTFSAITAKNGAVFTGSTAAKSDATITLFAKNDTVYDGARTYVVESMGSANDGIVIGKGTAGTLGALNDGDKVKVYTGSTYTEGTTAYYEYEVSGSVMVATYFDGTKSTATTYTLSDSADPGFTVGEAMNGAKINGDKGTDTETVTFGTAAGGTKQTTSLTDGVFVNADGSLTTSSSKAVAKVGIENDVVTYTSQSSKAQVVNVTKSSDNWNVTTGTGKDDVSFTTANVTSDLNINTAAGDDTIGYAAKGDAVINAGEGKDVLTIAGTGDVQVSLGAGNDTITATGAGDLLVYGESGNNFIDASGATGSVSISGGSGNDTIKAKGEDDVVYGGDGKNVFDVRTSSVTISDYSFEKDVVYATGFTGVNDEGKIYNGANKADISATAGEFYTAQINVGGTKAQNWAWAKDGGSNIDITSFTKDAHIQGDSDGVNTLYAGSGDDYIYSYSEKDSVYGGAGKDSISLTTASGATGRVVGIATTSGKDTVSGFKTGFSDADSLFMVDGSESDVKASFDSSAKRVTFKDGSGSMQMESIVAGKSGAVELKVGDTKFAVLASGAKATVDSASYADVFYGDGSIVDFSAVDEALSVNLSNGLAAGGEGAKFVGVSSIIGGKGDNTLMGSAKADSIVAGTGKSSLYGGAGADTLVGNSTESTVFFLGEGTNTNTITSFQTADKETADTVKILGDITAAKFANNAIELGTTDGSKAVISNLVSGSISANTMVKVEANNFNGIAKIGSSSAANNFTYDKSVNYYGGGSASDKVSVTSNFADNAEVWLDGSKGTTYASVDVLDFSNGAGNYVLAGDSSKQTIVGGRGESSLWGGTGNIADSIKGGTGTNTFFYGFGEGNDTISSSNSEDAVNLYNIKLSDVKTGEITNAGVSVEFNDGNKLTVATSKNITFKLASGETYVANHSTKGWDQA